jgi:hypothetical protein
MSEVQDTTVHQDTEKPEASDGAKPEDISNATPDELAKAKQIADDQRKRAEKAEAELKALKGKPTEGLNPEEIAKQAREAAKAELEQRDLDEMEHSDDIKKEIQKVAQLQGISIRKAAQDPYIKHMVERAEAARRADEAADNGARKGKTGIKVDPSKPLNPADYDLSTDEGRAQWQKDKEAHRKARQK